MGRQVMKKRELRAAIDALPLATRRAMLGGIQTNPIVVGADGDPRGGVCPIYATASPPSKRIGRPFARAWDRYAGARLPRRASRHELHTLRAMLEESIGRDRDVPPVASLSAAIAAHQALLARNRPTGDPEAEDRERSAELSRRDGWAWLRPFVRYDEYEAALRALNAMRDDMDSGSEPDRDPVSAGPLARN